MSALDLSALFPDERQGLSTVSQLRQAGLSRRALTSSVAGGAVVRICHRVYAPAALPSYGRHLVGGGTADLAYLAHVRAALLKLGPRAAACGRTAAVLWGMDLLVEPRKIEILVARARGDVSAAKAEFLRSSSDKVVAAAVGGLDPVRLTSPCDTVVRCALTRPLREAVVVADSALRSGLVTLEELRVKAHEWRGKPGGRRLRAVLPLVDADSGSVLESVFRYLMAQHGLFPASQVELRGRPGLIGRVDFLFERERLVVECDGRRWHDPADPRNRDRWRSNELTRAGWKVLRVTWEEVLQAPAYVVALVQDSLALAA